MGKSNRIRSEKAVKSVAGTTSSKNNKKKDNSLVYSLSVAAVALFVAVMLIVSVITSSGVVMRHSKAMHSEDYTVNGNMLKYMFSNEYNSFASAYSTYLSYFGLDTSKSLKEQEYGATDFLGEFDGTWYDYFMSSVKEQAQSMLLYCELADEKGISLDKDDMEEIEHAIADIRSAATSSGYDVNSYIALLYGEGIKLKDVRATIELSTLADKCATAIVEELNNNITDDRINSKYDENKRDYNVVDYATYYQSVTYASVAADVIDGYDGKTELTEEQKADVLEEYKKRIEEARKKAEKFKAFTNPDAFVDAMLEDMAGTAFDDLYETEALADADKLSEEDLVAVKAAMVQKVIEDIKSGKEETQADTVNNDGTYTAYGKTVTENAAKALDDIKSDLFAEIVAINDYYGDRQTTYKADEDLPKWAFEEAKAVGDIHTIEIGDGAKGAVIEKYTADFSIAVHIIKATEHRDETVSKDVAYMTFASLVDAKAAVQDFKAASAQNKEEFEAIAKSHSAHTSGLLENYLKGDLTYNGFEDWLYDDATVAGSYTQDPLANAATNASEYAVFFYVEDGIAAWAVDVKNDIYTEDYEAYYETLEEKYPITVEEKVLAKIDI